MVSGPLPKPNVEMGGLPQPQAPSLGPGEVAGLAMQTATGPAAALPVLYTCRIYSICVPAALAVLEG